MKKQLLQESEIRKMMKFADIGALSNGFVDRMNETYEMGEDLEENSGEVQEALEDLPPEPPVEDEVPEDEVPEEDVLPVEDEVPGGEMELSEEEAQVIIDLGNRLEGAMPEEGEEEIPVEDEEGLPVEDEFAMAGDVDMVDDEELVNEVSRRVSRRLAALRG